MFGPEAEHLWHWGIDELGEMDAKFNAIMLTEWTHDELTYMPSVVNHPSYEE